MKQLTLNVVIALVFSGLPWPGAFTASLHAEDEIDCPQGEGWLECRAAAGDRLAIYRLGRDAYEKSRASGDYAEPLRIGRELVALHDKNGARLLKMTHLQLSWGHHKDNVQAYVWLVEDQKKGLDYLGKLIRDLGDRMTPEQLARAKELAGQ